MLTLRDWLLVIAAGVFISVFGTGCSDSADAANIAQDEKRAHEQKQTVMAWWYSETYQPIKASDANVAVTVCQQTDSTINWYCHAGAPTR